MRVEKDYEELFGLLNRNKVKYCVVGAYAVAFYSKPRYTKDLDILVEPIPANAKRVLKALKAFGFKSMKLSEKDFTRKGKIIQLGYEPVRVDFLTSIQGLEFEEVWRNRKLGRYGRCKVNFIGKAELVKNKRIVNRKQDKADLALLLPSEK